MKKINPWAVFTAGSIGYPCLELLWRGRTHPSMALAGGASLYALMQIARHGGRYSVPVRACVGAAAITGIELLCGLMFNRRYQVWDYRGRHHFMGQICLEYSGLWYLISLAALHGFERIKT